MPKERHFSTQNDFGTGLFYKLSLLLGIFLLLFYVFLRVISLVADQNNAGLFQFLYTLSQSNAADAALAFSIIFLGIGIILYFFHRQFVKLSKIAEEIENEEENEGSD